MKNMMVKLAATLLVLVLFVSCGGDGSGGGANYSSTSKSAEEKRALEQAGNEKISEVNEFEKQMEQNSFVKFSSKIDGINNGAMEKTITILFTGSTRSDVVTAKEHIDRYIELVETLLGQYPEDQYAIIGRDEIKTKLSLAHQFLKKLNNYLENN